MLDTNPQIPDAKGTSSRINAKQTAHRLSYSNCRRKK